ncbi:MAG: EAL domain-containing protein [Hydrogenophilales bacterium]|nr:EAL domain-containing protein [Hydrogenophilales bacterium]
MANLKILLSLLGAALALALWTPTAMGLNALLLAAALAFGWIELRARHRIDDRVLAARVFETSGNGILISDAQNRVLAVNPAFSTITGYARDEIVGKTPNILRSGRHDSAFYESMWQAINTQGMWQGEIWNKRKNGEIYAEWLTIDTVKNPLGEAINYIAVFSDITERKTLAERVEYLATHDTLTGLPNRALLAELLSKAIADAGRSNTHLAVFFLDMDRFKLVNDTLGHAIGDELLKAVAARLQDATRAGDMLARQGGDEFIMALPNLTGIPDAAHIAEKVLLELGRTFELGSHTINSSTSVGIALFPEDGEDAFTLLKHADAAMYRAKELGRNNFQFFAADMNINMLERLALERGLRQALDRGELQLRYQPQFDLATGRVLGAEALLHWLHPEHGLLPPAKFLTIAEESGLINPIGAWVLREACLEAQRWQSADHPLRVAVNLSAVQLRQFDFAQRVAALIADTGIAPDLLELDLHENTLLLDTPALNKLLHALHDQGIRLAIDDFGAGYSSLANLKRLPIDKLKIACALVRELPQEPIALSVVRTILCMGESLQLDVAAEGVETEAQRAWLVQHGCRFAQGFFFAGPMPAQAFRDFLGAQREANIPVK